MKPKPPKAAAKPVKRKTVAKPKPYKRKSKADATVDAALAAAIERQAYAETAASVQDAIATIYYDALPQGTPDPFEAAGGRHVLQPMVVDVVYAITKLKKACRSTSDPAVRSAYDDLQDALRKLIPLAAQAIPGFAYGFNVGLQDESRVADILAGDVGDT